MTEATTATRTRRLPTSFTGRLFGGRLPPGRYGGPVRGGRIAQKNRYLGGHALGHELRLVAAAPNLRRNAGSSMSRARQRSSDAGSPGSAKRPVSSSTTTSGIPPARQHTIGFANIMASSRIRPKDSNRDGAAKMSQAR